jgi:transposase
MILTAIYHMLVTGEVFNPSDLYKIDMPQEMVEKQKEKAIKQAVKLVISQGLIKATDLTVIRKSKLITKPLSFIFSVSFA